MKEISVKKASLTKDEIEAVVVDALKAESLQNKRVLLILPDLSRSAPVDILYKLLYRHLSEKVACLDGLIALGTHQPLSMENIFKRVGITKQEYRQVYGKKTTFYNHQWDDKGALTAIGCIEAEEVAEITGGLLTARVDVTINKLICDYDLLMVLGPVFPHEIVGFSGGNKYFFPGVCGSEILSAFHWLGGLITNAVINGSIDSPVRNLINRAAEFITVPRLYFHMVVNHGALHALFPGDGIADWRKAAELSSQVNITHTGRTYRRVLGLAPLKYDELWTAGKVAYKAETIVEDGGELIIYAPHISEISSTHGSAIKRVGYHVKDYCIAHRHEFNDVSGIVLSHLIAVKGTGTYLSGIETPRIRVTLATGIPKAVCDQINLPYLDPASINPKAWKDREDEGTLVIPDAGEVLYKKL